MRRASLWLAPPLIPFLLWAAMLPWMGRLPANDYYGIVAQVADGAHFTADPLRWLAVKSNEHTVVFPALLYAANVVLGDGDNRVLSALALVTLLLLAALLARRLPPPLAEGSAQTPVWALLVALLVFTPAAAHSIVLGFSGTIWFVANLLAVTAIHQFARLAERPSAARAAAVLVAAFACTLTYSTSLALWVALLLGAWLYRLPLRYRFALATGAAPAIVFLTVLYSRPEQHPGPVLDDPVSAARFVAVYLGGPLAADAVLAGCLGIAGLLLAAGIAATLIANRTSLERAALLPWLLLQVYAVGNALGTAVARADLGGARSSRYASVAILFWISLAVVGTASACRPGIRWGVRSRAVPLAAVALLVGATWFRGAPVLVEYLRRAARHPLAELALVHDIGDRDALTVASPKPGEIEHLRAFMAARGSVPFDLPLVVAGERVATAGGLTAPLGRVRASSAAVDERAVRVLLTPAQNFAAGSPVVIVADGTICGEIRETGEPWLVSALRGGTRGARWEGYLAVDAVCRPLLLGMLVGSGVVPIAELELPDAARAACPSPGLQ